MKKSFKLLGAGALLFAGGFLGSYFANTHGVEQRVKKEVEKTRLEARITLPFGTDTLFAIPDTFSAREKFSDDSEEYDYWKTKVGFSYQTDNLREGIGTEYNYSIMSPFLDHTDEWLSIWNFDGKPLGRILGSSQINIYDEDHDTIPDRINIEDRVNNTSVTINRDDRRGFLDYVFLDYVGGDRKGVLIYQGCNQETAKALFDLYTAKFQEFQRVHNIIIRIDSYIPKMEIIEINPWSN